MSFRGRGRGRGRGFGGRGFGGYVPPEPFVLFPDIELPDVKAVPEEKTLVVWNSRLLNYWKASPYYLEEHVSKKSQSMDIERFSDWGKPKNTSKRDSLNQSFHHFSFAGLVTTEYWNFRFKESAAKCQKNAMESRLSLESASIVIKLAAYHATIERWFNAMLLELGCRHQIRVSVRHIGSIRSKIFMYRSLEHHIFILMLDTAL
ncbi:nucleolar transcription factor 1-like [Gossypium australe]|uniref:Nucleolar transcription factor 1-like n=1 Tax=Gossypium australe TaxID=47621 RepID=A0A5B6UG63_9ROSI|nr:nucleolar transcription factor 1-like [Gossypium australe]